MDAKNEQIAFAIALDIPRMFVEEFLKRIPPYIKYRYYSYLISNSVVPSLDEAPTGMTLLVRDKDSDVNSEHVSITAEIFDEKIKSDYIEFLHTIGYQDKRDVRLFEVREMKNI